MISRVSSKNKGKQDKKKTSIKKQKLNRKKEQYKANRNQRRRKSNPLHTPVQATPCPLHHSAEKNIFLCHRRCLKLVEPYLSRIYIYIWLKLA